MKKAMSLASLAVLAVTSGAMALTEGLPRQVRVAGSPAGTMTMFYTTNLPGPTSQCLYDVDWESPFQAAGSVLCEIGEQKVLGHTSCLANRRSNFPSIVQNRAGCMGFDAAAFPQAVWLLLGEGVISPALNGLAVFSLFPILPRPISIS